VKYEGKWRVPSILYDFSTVEDSPDVEVMLHVGTSCRELWVQASVSRLPTGDMPPRMLVFEL